MDEEFFDRLREKVNGFMEGVDPCHDIMHVDRVVAMAMVIGRKEGANLEIVRAAALLHDVARREQDESKGRVCHAERGGELASEILREMGISEEIIEKIVRCVKVHRFRKGNVPESVEARVLYDADKLDALGAIIIARVFARSGETGSPLHDPNIKQDDVYTSSVTTAINHFHEKILKITPDTFHTEAAKEIAEKRYPYTKQFIERFLKEWDGEI